MATTTQTGRAAVIGLGSMGSGMAGSLLRAGFSVAACDVNPEAVARFREAGGTAAAHPAEAADGADVVVSVVVNAAQTEAVLFGEHGAAAAMPVHTPAARRFGYHDHGPAGCVGATMARVRVGLRRTGRRGRPSGE